MHPTTSWIGAALLLTAACSSGSSSTKPDGGEQAVKLGENPSVPDTCQMCLSSSSANECQAKGKICSADMECAKLNACVNKCANINAACIQSCGDAASQNAIDEWNTWAGCTCGTCASQCNQTFCNIGSGPDGGQCTPDDQPCSTSQACCTFCATDGTCGCIPPQLQGCQIDHDCCSNVCNAGVCN
jgi:hypothetical protein